MSNVCEYVCKRQWDKEKNLFTLQKDTAIHHQETGTKLLTQPLTLYKAGRLEFTFNFFEHQHLIANLTGAQAYKRFTLFL